MAFGIGGSGSTSKSNFDQNIANPEAWNQYYGNIGGMFNQMSPLAMGGFNYLPQMDPVMSGAVGAGGQGTDYMMGGGSFGDTSDVRSRLLNSMGGRSNTGRMYEDIVGGPGNTYIDPLVDAMRGSAMETRGRMRSGNALEAVAMGQPGSSRHAMENVMGDRRMDEDLARRELGMRAGAYDTDLNWKMDIAKMADQNQQLEQDRMMKMLSGADQNVGTGMGYQPTMQNLGMGMMNPYTQAFMLPWMGMQQYSSAMGDPTVLSSGESKGKSISGGFGL